MPGAPTGDLLAAAGKFNADRDAQEAAELAAAEAAEKAQAERDAKVSIGANLNVHVTVHNVTN